MEHDPQGASAVGSQGGLDRTSGICGGAIRTRRVTTGFHRYLCASADSVRIFAMKPSGVCVAMRENEPAFYEVAALPGARLIREPQAVTGPNPSVYAYPRFST